MNVSTSTNVIPLLIQRKPVHKTESVESLQDLLGDLLRRLARASVHTRAGGINTSVLERNTATADSSHGLTVPERIDQDLERSGRRVESRGGGRVHLVSESGGGEEALHTIGDDEGVKVDGIRQGVGGVDTIGVGLGDNVQVDASGRELRGHGLALLDGFGVGVRGQEADLQTLDAEEGLAEGTDVGGLVGGVVSRVGGGLIETKTTSDTDGEVVVDHVQLVDNVLPNVGAVNLGVLKDNGVDNHLLLSGDQRVPEHGGLGPVVIEGRAGLADEMAGSVAVGRGEETMTLGLVGLHGVTVAHAVGGVGPVVGGDLLLAEAVTVVVVNGLARTVDGDLLEVGTAVTGQLSVEVGEETALQQGVVGEVNARNDVTGLELQKLDYVWHLMNGEYIHQPVQLQQSSWWGWH